MSTWLKVYLASLLLIAVSFAVFFIGYCLSFYTFIIVGAGGVIMGLISSVIGIAIIDDDKEE